MSVYTQDIICHGNRRAQKKTRVNLIKCKHMYVCVSERERQREKRVVLIYLSTTYTFATKETDLNVSIEEAEQSRKHTITVLLSGNNYGVLRLNMPLISNIPDY